MVYPQSLKRFISEASPKKDQIPKHLPPSRSILSANLSRMHAIALRAFRTAQRPISRRACRIIGGVRYPLPQRNFHRSAISYRISEDPAISEAERERENQEVEAEAGKVENEGADGSKTNGEVENLAVSQRARNGRN